MASPHGRVNSSSPRVASEDSAKPNERASHGSTTSTTTIAAPSTGGPAERRDRLSPIRPIAPITAARTTLGSGRASTTNPARPTRASTGRSRRGTPTRTHSPRTSPVTTATLLPLTAVRWVIPVARMAAVRSGGVRLVSPMTRPGSSPLGSAGAWSTDARRPLRSRSAAAATAPGGASTSGGPLTDKVATRSSARSVGPSRPRTRMVARHPGSAIAGSPVSSTGAPVARRMPRASSTRDGRLAQHHRPVAATRQHDRVAGDHGDGGDGRPVGGEGLDATASAQHAVRGGGDLEHHDQGDGEQHRAEHAPSGAGCGGPA